MPDGSSYRQSVVLTQNDLNRLLAAHERFVYGQGGQRLQVKNANLRGLNLANRNLSDADFTGATLTRATFFGSNLSRATLCCADLRESDLESAKMTKADLRGASFKGAKMSYAQLDGADIRAATIARARQTNLTQVTTVDYADARHDPAMCGVDFSNCAMKAASFKNARLEHANFNGAFLQGASFKGAKLFAATFLGAVLMDINLRELGLPPAVLESCVLDAPVDSSAKAEELKRALEIHLEWIQSDGKRGVAAVLDGEDLRVIRDRFAGSLLIGLSACGTNAVGIDFSRSKLQGSKFDDADLRGADFMYADLSGASFKNAKLAFARFDKAILRKIDLIGGGVVTPDLTQAEISKHQLDNAILDEEFADLGLKV